MKKNELKKYDAYKPSGVEWLGDIPAHWEVFRFKTIVHFCNRGTTPDYVENSNYKIINQATFSKGYFDFETTKYTSERSINKNFTKAKVKKNDVLLASTGGGVLGKVYHFHLNADNYYADSHVTIIRFTDYGLSRFIYYFLSINYALINGILAQGSTNQTELQKSWLDNLLISLPPLSEQTVIVKFLDKQIVLINKAITLKEEQIALLKERRQAIIQQTVTKGLNPDVPVKDSGIDWIGYIPEHWEIIKNKTLFQERKERGNETLPLLSVSIHNAVSDEELNEDENIRGKIRIEDKSQYKLVKPGDIVFNMMRAWQGGIGAVSRMGMVSPAYIVAKPLKAFNSIFWECQHRTDKFIQQMDRSSKGITDFRKRLYWDEFKQLFTALPPESEQIEIVRYLSSLNEKINILVEKKLDEIQKLKEYKASLINNAVTGKIKVA